MRANNAYREVLPNEQDRIRAWISRWHSRQGVRDSPRWAMRKYPVQFPAGSAYESQTYAYPQIEPPPEEAEGAE